MGEVALVLLDLLERAAPERRSSASPRSKARTTGRVILPSRKSSPMLLPSTTSRAL